MYCRDPGQTGVSALDFGRWNVIENKIDSTFIPFVHHAMLFLVVNFVDVTDGHALGAAVDHEPHSGIGIDRYVDAMAIME